MTYTDRICLHWVGARSPVFRSELFNLSKARNCSRAYQWLWMHNRENRKKNWRDLAWSMDNAAHEPAPFSSTFWEDSAEYVLYRELSRLYARYIRWF